MLRRKTGKIENGRRMEKKETTIGDSTEGRLKEKDRRRLEYCRKMLQYLGHDVEKFYIYFRQREQRTWLLKYAYQIKT